MRKTRSAHVAAAIVLCALPLAAQQQDSNEKSLEKELQERQERLFRLSIDEQLKLRAAETKAAEDPAVIDALKKRDDAIRNYRATLRATMIKVDPSIAPLLERIAEGSSSL